jgi:hypothetical protein
MITEWRYTDIPDGIDLAQPLMPLRDANDNGIYGIDPAWLHETLATWDVMLSAGSDRTKATMPISPSADWTNGLRTMANNIKGKQDYANPNRFVSSAPAAAFSPSDTEHYVTFGDVPANVKRGDPVRRKDVSDMFAWMDVGASHVRCRVSYAYSGWSYSTTSGGDGETPPLPVEYPAAYEWSWHYSNFGNPPNPYGYWRRMVATFNVSATLTNVQAAWFDSVAVFLLANVYTSDGDARSLYVPISATVTQHDEGVTLSATVSGRTIRDAFNVTEKAYKEGVGTDAEGSYQCRVSVSNVLVAYCKIADDYRPPSAET